MTEWRKFDQRHKKMVEIFKEDDVPRKKDIEILEWDKDELELFKKS